MANVTRNWLMAGLIGLLVACGGGGGGDRAAGVEPGPQPPGQPVPPPAPVQPTPVVSYAEAEQLLATITGVTIPDDGRPVVEWQLTDGHGTAILDLTPDNVRFAIGKLQKSSLGNMTGTWQSYVNRVRNGWLQGTYERDAGEFTNHDDGTYTYRMAVNVKEQAEDVLAQAEADGLDVSYEPNLVHRLGMQFDNAQVKLNPTYDFVPATGATSGLMTMDIVATDNCNRCHNPLAIHGGGRVETRYCVICHNPGSSHDETANTVDFKVMIHKIHRGRDLPSVEAGGEYRVGSHDYTHLGFPQDIRNCTSCHAGSGTIGDREGITLTSQGDNWNEYPSRAVCGSCHDDEDFSTHKGGQVNDNACALCHSEGGQAGSIREVHQILAQEARETLAAEILSVSNTAPGETPVASFRVFNPQSGQNYDILNDPVWTNSSSRLRVRFAWDTRDYHNTGNGEEDASSVMADALEDAVPNGDGSYHISSPVPIPDGSGHPGVAATGSGVAVIEGRAYMQLEEGEDPERVSLTNVHQFFSIDEPDGEAVPRREVVAIENCQNCHVTLAHHGSARADNIDSCVTCHNPRNTDREGREGADEPPADGLKEQAVDFKIMIHGIHAAGMREHPIMVEDTVFDEEEVHFPGDLSDCETCHEDDTYVLPLADGVLAPTVDTGDDLEDPADDTVTTPIAAVCSSCHDEDEVHQHMVSQGANFATTQAAIDNGNNGGVVESCPVCHGEGKEFDVEKVHKEH